MKDCEEIGIWVSDQYANHIETSMEHPLTIAQQMQRSYSTFIMLKHTMSSSIFLVFSSSTSKFSFSLLIIHLTFKLAFLLLYLLSRISFKQMIMMKVQYPLIHTKQLTHHFLLIFLIAIMVVSLMRVMMRKIHMLNYTGQILQIKCGKAT